MLFYGFRVALPCEPDGPRIFSNQPGRCDLEREVQMPRTEISPRGSSSLVRPGETPVTLIFYLYHAPARPRSNPDRLRQCSKDLRLRPGRARSASCRLPPSHKTHYLLKGSRLPNRLGVFRGKCRWRLRRHESRVCSVRAPSSPTQATQRVIVPFEKHFLPAGGGATRVPPTVGTIGGRRHREFLRACFLTRNRSAATGPFSA